VFGDSDLGAIFDPQDFGVAIVWTPNGGMGASAVGILDVYEDVFRHGAGPGGFQNTEFLLRVPAADLGGVPRAFDVITIAVSPNLPPGFVPGAYTVKELPKCLDPSIIDMVLKGPTA
jgi:hypothetical protein